MNVRSVPVENQPFLYVSGMNISAASTTVLGIAPGSCRDYSDTLDIIFRAPFFINSAVTGAGGLDQGTFAASTNYAVYAVADSHNKLPPTALISLTSNVSPALPFGYDSYRLIGFANTNGSTNFTAAAILNTAYNKGYYLQPPVAVLTGGQATTFTAIDLSTAIPTTTDQNVIALLNVVFTPAAAGDTVVFRPTGSTATANLVTVTGQTAGVPVSVTVPVICGVASSKPEVDYKVASASDSVNVSVAGYNVTLS